MPTVMTKLLAAWFSHHKRLEIQSPAVSSALYLSLVPCPMELSRACHFALQFRDSGFAQLWQCNLKPRASWQQLRGRCTRRRDPRRQKRRTRWVGESVHPNQLGHKHSQGAPQSCARSTIPSSTVLLYLNFRSTTRLHCFTFSAAG
jgi:hypothetical protein